MNYYINLWYFLNKLTLVEVFLSRGNENKSKLGTIFKNSIHVYNLRLAFKLVSYENKIIWQQDRWLIKIAPWCFFSNPNCLVFSNSSIVLIMLAPFFYGSYTYFVELMISLVVMVYKLDKCSEISVRNILLDLVYGFSIFGWSCPLCSFTTSTICTTFSEDVYTFAVQVMTLQRQRIEKLLDSCTFRYVNFFNNNKFGF